jgi:hypothetical protein
MYKADASGAEKEQNEETKAADATKKNSCKDKALKRTHVFIDLGWQQNLKRISHFSSSIINKIKE